MGRHLKREERKLDKDRARRARQRVEEESREPPADAAADEGNRADLPADFELPPPFTTERAMRQLFGGMRGSDDQARAQELAYEAMEARSPKRAAELCLQALELDRHCIDAMVMLCRLTCDSPREMIDLIRDAVRIGAEGLGGPRYFEECRGHFWGLLETRPYMRARALLVDLLLKDGRTDEAVRDLEELLDLNPADNQGLRYRLLGCYLMANNLDGARRLFKQYDDEASAMFAWARVLERFLSDDSAGSQAALEEARKTNRHVESFLTGRRKAPSRLPEYYGFGDENEAVICLHEIGPTWQKHPRAIEWLCAAG
jgi:tetratricopeptide (TPR) repeat protein